MRSKLFMKFAGAIGMVLALAACSTPKDVAYFQDRADGTSIEILNQQVIRVQPSDKLSIIVNSKNPELANMFNLPVYTSRIGATERTSNLTASQQISCYTVDPEGNIDFPQLGKIHVTGMQRQEIATLIKAKLIETQLVLDPIVTVEFANLYFSILGEVTHPGRFTIDQDKISLLIPVNFPTRTEHKTNRNQSSYKSNYPSHICLLLSFISVTFNTDKRKILLRKFI